MIRRPYYSIWEEEYDRLQKEIARRVEEREAMKNEWIWVDGFKGTNRDMKCRDFQFELGKQFDIPEGEEIEACKNGFHLCKTVNDVYDYYPIGNGNRFFKVRALVRKYDAEHYGPGLYNPGNKLVARSIIFEEELTANDILPDEAATWSDENKMLALEKSVAFVLDKINIDKLVELGYSKPFAKYIINNGKYETAKAVGSQPDLSMDMKCMIIFQ